MIQRYGGIDVLVNNAGIAISSSSGLSFPQQVPFNGLLVKRPALRGSIAQTERVNCDHRTLPLMSLSLSNSLSSSSDVSFSQQVPYNPMKSIHCHSQLCKTVMDPSSSLSLCVFLSLLTCAKDLKLSPNVQLVRFLTLIGFMEVESIVTTTGSTATSNPVFWF